MYLFEYEDNLYKLLKELNTFASIINILKIINAIIENYL